MLFKRILLASASIALVLPFTATAQTASPAAPVAAAPAAATAAPAAPAAAPAAGTAEKTSTVTNPTAPVTRGEFEALLKETLLNNPQIVMDTVKKLHEQRTAETNKEMKEALARNKEALATDESFPRIGNLKDADVTIYEFFDYHCGYCKHMLPVVSKLIESDKKVRIVFLEFPILSEDSVTASRASLAVYRLEPTKYFDFHAELMKAKGKFDEKAIADIAKKVGLDWKKVKKEMSSEEVTGMLDKARALAEDLGIRGTPAFIIGDEILPGAIPIEDMNQIIEAVRKGESPKLVKTKSTAEPPPPRDPSAPAAKAAAPAKEAAPAESPAAH